MLASGKTLLPSKRTLRDHTHWLELKPGFNTNVVDYLRNEIKIDTLPEWKMYGDVLNTITVT